MGIERDIQEEAGEEEAARKLVDDGKAMDRDDLPKGTEDGPEDSAAFTPSHDDSQDRSG